MFEPLNPLTLPLHGSRLIEASAGTGKTWTIAALVLRLVLADGAPATADIATAFAADGAAGGGPLARPLLPAEILVMTFTKAATRELADRIRRRLVEAAACFRGDAGPADDDNVLRGLLQRHPPGPRRAAAAWRLAAAAEAMDDAAIFTIDAWCQRMLREHAFDSGCLFDEELQADEAALLHTAARDYWRQQVYPLPAAALAVVAAQWPGVDALAGTARQLLEQQLPAGAGQGSLGDCIAAAAAGRAAQVAALKHGWVARCEQMRDWLEGDWANPAGRIDKKILAPRYARQWLDALRDWAGDADAVALDLRRGSERLTDAGIRAALRPAAAGAAAAADADLPRCFAEFAALQRALQALPDPAAALVAHAASNIAERLQQLKAQAGRYGFADMLQRLHDALDERAHGDNARRLRARILQQYPAALIDEFQDTSPLQLAIFDRLYRIAADEPGRVLLLIGDPKQSIYGFRGADIHSYLQARRATRGRHHVLGTNHRATAPLVDAINALFGAAEARPGEGAFLFGQGGGAAAAEGADGGLPFLPVAAAGRPERLVTAAGPVPAITFCLDATLRSQGDSRAIYAALCAERIVALLNDAAAGFAADAAPAARPKRRATAAAAASAEPAPAAGLQRLRPADIAVLVRTGTEAAAVRHALRARGVASVYLSDKDSVFAGAEAPDLLRLLQAVASPRDVRLARAALATPLLALPLAELVALASDDALFDARCALLQQLHAAWQQQGVLAMLRRALHALDLPARWLATGGSGGDLQHDGERRLTNVLHLAELLQAASAQRDGEQALIRWLAQEVDAAAGTAAAFNADDSQVLRLESDADLVQVVTVHKSKGLEYPLVFLPFAAACRPVDRRDTVSLPAADGGRALVLSPTQEQLADADKERQREDLRLLYVALTRARHAVWVGAAALKVGNGGGCTWHRSALGHLLSGAGVRSADEVAQDVRAWHGHGASVEVQEVALDGDTGVPRALHARARLQPRGALPPLAPALAYSAAIDRLWAVTSYSALVKDIGRAAAPRGAGAAVAGGAEARADEGEHDGAGDGEGDGSGNVPSRVQRDDEPLELAATGAVDGASDDARNAGDDGHGAGSEVARIDTGAGADGAAPWHRFPRGAVTGNFLHDLLEWLADEGFALDDPAQPPSLPPAHTPLQQALLRRCAREGWGHRADDVLAWLRSVCATPLPATGAALSQLDAVLPEMEFWLPSDGLRASAVDALCRQHILPGRPRPALPERSLRGMLMGFADLVFAHGGRYWVLDYKSNALGAGDAAYGSAAMEHAMLQHRYDVQAALYLLALHRLLRQRLGAAYRPARQLGGAVYLFLRGIGSAGAGCFHQPPPLALLAGLEALLDQGSASHEAPA